MTHLHIFTDGSVNLNSKVGYGAYLVVSDLRVSLDELKNLVEVRRFEQTSSTKLELQILLWSLIETIALTKGNDIAFTVYTDSQNIIDLPRRRARLEQNDFFSNKGRRLSNYELYREFYQITSRVKCKMVKVVGHQASSKKDKIHLLFSLVDKASRFAMRGEV